MFVNKIIGVSPRLNFKSTQHTVNSVGKTVEYFGYPYDPETQECEIEFVRVKRNKKYNIELDDSSKKVVQLTPNGIKVDPQELLNLDRNESYAYKIRIKDKNTGETKEVADTGIQIKKEKNDEYIFVGENNSGEYTLGITHGTTPMANGAGYLAIPDSLLPAAKFRGFDDPNTGEIYMDEAAQKNAEKALRNFSNVFGGGIAGLIATIPYLKENGYSMLFTTPVANGDDVSSHSYWNKNNFQIAPKMGNTENFADFARETYKNGIQYVYDGTFTSEGLEGIHFQYALRWAQKNPQTYYWFRMQSLRNSNLGLGVIPDNAKNLSHRVVNAPYNYEKQSDGTYKKIENKQYNPNKETYFQIFDASQVSESQKNKLDEQIRIYENITSGNVMDINTHDDTLIAYSFQINPNEYQDRIDAINKLIKSGKNIDLYKEDGTVLAGQFSNFKIDKKTEGGFVTWDANTDMVKMNYGISGYDLKNLKSITNRAARYHEQQMIERGAKEVQDMTLQAGRYWTGVFKDVQTLYTAKTVGTLKTADEINNLIKEGKLPKKAEIDKDTLSNILNGTYLFSGKGNLSKDDVTVKSLMKLPLDAIEFGENTAGVLSTSYFSNRATTDETVGKTRFELLKENNPHLVKEYAKVYNKVNSLYTNELRNFTNQIIEKVNESSNEKLLDSSGNYTEYGEYVLDLVGKDIAKYALLKSLAGENFRTKVLKNGDLTYDYDKIRANTSLKALGINANDPEEEAELLEKHIRKGLKNLNSEDIQNVAKSIGQRISGTDTNSFRIAEALVNKASCGLAWRLDAAKDIEDQDAVRNREEHFDDAWDRVISFWKKFVQTVKSENPNSYIVAEVTDVADLIRNTYGADSSPYDGNTNVNDTKFNGHNEAETKFFSETGITSEAGYSYLFTNLLSNFSGNFENGEHMDDLRYDFDRRVKYLMSNRTPDYIRNLYTFIGNHDKTRTIQGLSVDMKLFQSPISYKYENDGKIDFSKESEQRQKVIEVLSGATSPDEVPIELRLNIDNMDYFRTISPKAAAQAKALLLPVKEDLKGIASNEDIKAITDAIVDLANGNYLVDKTTKSMTRINIPEISTLDKAVSLILDMAEKKGYKVDSKTREYIKTEIIKNANTLDINDYQVRGDFNWGNPNKEIGDKNKEYLKQILGTDNDGSNYSLYTVQLARLIKDSYNKIHTGSNIANPAFDEALKDFINKYNRELVESKTSEPVKTESISVTRNKDSFGVKPFENAMEWVINQAEFKTGRKFTNRQAIIDKVVTSVTEPAIQKQAMMLQFLSGLVGIPTVFAGDEYGMSGYEDKAKNKYLNNRNTVNRNRAYADRYSKITNNAIKDRINSDLQALNNGTPYALSILVGDKTKENMVDEYWKNRNNLNKTEFSQQEKDNFIKENKKLARELNKVAYMMHAPSGDTVVTVFSTQDVIPAYRFDYYKYLADEYGIDTEAKRKKAFEDGTIYSINPDNKYVPIQYRTEMDAILLGAGVALPVGTIFMNADARDKVVYEVRRVGKNLDKLGIVRKDGKKIVMDAKSALNGVMRLIRKTSFRGRNLNQKYPIVSSNAYKINEIPEEGKNLSLIAK